MTGEIAYLLCALTSIACAALLFRSYRRERSPLLMWSTFAFTGLAGNNVLLFVDLTIVPEIDLLFWRTLTALLAISVLVVGLILETR